MQHKPLQKVLGTGTALLIGMGVAIGSGIFRTPGEVAATLHSTGWILAAWIVGGLIVVVQGMVTAELATRFPKAGGEYVYLKEAYGEFIAFFFGWAYTIFIIGGGAATIASAFGDFTCELMHWSPRVSGLTAAGAIATVMVVNSLGVRAGAGAQNALTVVKVVALMAIAILAAFPAASATVPEPPPAASTGQAFPVVFLAALLPVLWSYDGTTDAVKMAEEVRGVRRTMPLACIGSALALIVLYALFNVALMRQIDPSEMGGLSSVPGEAMYRRFGDAGRNGALVVAMVVCLGSLSSTVFATIRVTFALARDGLTFRWMATMSNAQAPVPALAIVGVFAIVLVLHRDFMHVLRIYFFASAILFGLSYASLLVFRHRDTQRRTDVYRCPFGVWLASFLVLFHLCLAVQIAITSPGDVLYTVYVLVALGALYVFWKWSGLGGSRPQSAGEA